MFGKKTIKLNSGPMFVCLVKLSLVFYDNFSPFKIFERPAGPDLKNFLTLMSTPCATMNQERVKAVLHLHYSS